MSSVLVAGGAGFIGSHLCRALLTKGYNVICVDNLLSGSKENISDLLSNPNFTFLEHDITKEISNIQYPISNIQYVFHLASPASPNPKSPRSYISLPIETLQANSVGTKNLLDFVEKTHARFVYASTSEVYGDPQVSPQKEEYWGNVNPNGIRSVYDEGKRFGEAMIMAYVRKNGLDARIARIFNTYGPFMQIDDGRVVSNFIVQALRKEPMTIYGNGNQTRSFCYVSDLVEGLMALMFADNLQGEVVNLGNPNEKTILEFAKLIQKLTSTSSEIIHEDLPQDDPQRRNPDITKAKALLNWQPTVTLEEGLKKAIEYFKEKLKITNI